MSHFTCLVVGPNVKQQLAPFHEFESTGLDDEFVKDIDKTEVLRKEYEAATSLRLRDQRGILHDPYDAKFYREPTEEEVKKHGPMIGSGWGGGLSWTSRDWEDWRGHRAKIRFVPEGFTEVQIPERELQTFAQYIESEGYDMVGPDGIDLKEKEKHKYKYAIVDDDSIKAIKRTNPEARWDWWRIGGRWSGYFKLKPLGVGLKPGKHFADGGVADQALKEDIDFEAMRDEKAGRARESYRLFHKTVAGRDIPTWEEIRAKNNDDMDLARQEWRSNPVVVDLEKLEGHPFWDVDYAEFKVSEEEFVQKARNKAIATFAVVMDGKWYEKGKMGWWACVADEKSDWPEEFAKLLDGIPDDTLLTLVDCHI